MALSPSGGIIRDFFLDVGYSLVPGYRRVTALGRNTSANAGEDIWLGSAPYTFLAAASILEVLSDNAADAAAGTGARTVLVSGLDASYVEISETVTLNGVTPVATINSYLRVNSAIVTTAGSSETNTGTITVRVTGGGTTQAVIGADDGITAQGVFSVPAGHTLQIVSSFFCFNALTASTRFATFSTRIRTNLGVVRQPFRLSIGDEPPYRHDGIPGIIVPEKNDFSWRCTFVSNANSDLTAAFLGVMHQNSVL